MEQLNELIGNHGLAAVLTGISQHCEDSAEFETGDVKRAKLEKVARELDKLAALLTEPTV